MAPGVGFEPTRPRRATGFLGRAMRVSADLEAGAYGGPGPSVATTELCDPGDAFTVGAFIKALYLQTCLPHQKHMHFHLRASLALIVGHAKVGDQRRG